MHIAFIKAEDGSYVVDGRGANKFGKFTLRGTLGADHMMQIYREYEAKPLAQSPKKRTASSAGIGGDDGGDGQQPVKKAALAPLAAPRDAGSKRDRKPSALMADASGATQFARPSPRPSTAPAPAPAPVAPKPESHRTQRTPPHIQKCHELLKELSKLPQGVFFQEPVDYVKLNIPDYPSIIKQPMDFRTVKNNLDNGAYPTADAFAAHVRQVFSNATTYNQSPAHPVHVAATILATRFEERYRQMLVRLGHPSDEPLPAQLQSHRRHSTAGVSHAAAATSASSGPARKSLGAIPKGGSKNHHKAVGRPPLPAPRASGGQYRGPGRPMLEPRIAVAGAYGPPPVVDSSAQVVFEMQRRMEQMDSELRMLRTKVHPPTCLSTWPGGTDSAPFLLTTLRTPTRRLPDR